MSKVTMIPAKFGNFQILLCKAKFLKRGEKDRSILANSRQINNFL